MKIEDQQTLIKNIQWNRLLWYGHLKTMDATKRYPQKIRKWILTDGRGKMARHMKNKNEEAKEAMKKKGLAKDDWQRKKQWLFGC